jgi:outer membrane lipopolysaccharide assembly protein LptE/RlpB
MNNTPKLFMAVLLLACGVIAGCGYRFSGGGDLPGGIRKLSVGVFENNTRENGLETRIANDLIYQFSKYGNIKLTDKSASDAHLTGVIRKAAVTTITHATAIVSAERRIQVTMDATLTAAASGEVLWSEKGITAYETYAVAKDKSGTEQNKKSALADLSSRVAERIYYRLTDNF